MTIKNLNVKKRKVVIGNYSEVEILRVTSVSEVANLAQNHKNIIKKLIISGTNSSDLTGIRTIGEDNGALPNLESIELKNITELPNTLFSVSTLHSNTWLESFSAPEATYIGNGAFENCVALTEINLPMVTTIGKNAFYWCDVLTKLTLGETNITVINDTFVGLTTGQVDLYLSATEITNNVTNGNQWTKGGKTWTFKSIQQIP